MKTVNRVNENYVVIDNKVLHDKNLSLEAIGLYCELMSYPEDTTLEEFLAIPRLENEQTTRAIIKEVEDSGYLTIEND